MTKICPHCKKEFEIYNNAQKYCSESCRIQALVLRKKKYGKCAFCGKKIEISELGKFCSKECIDKANAVPKRIRRKKPRISLEEVARLSREAGLSYGKYVQLHGI